jgi:hypothetical protein
MPFTLDPDIIIATLRHTTSKNTTFVLVEDKILTEQYGTSISLEPYRFMRRQLMKENIDFFSCMGVNNLMGVFNRRNELANLHVLFFRDRDLLIHTGIPGGLTEMLFTKGYSIENDVYAETGIEDILLTPVERQNHTIAKRNFILWYAAKIHQTINGLNSSYKTSPIQILSNTHEVRLEYQIGAQEILDSAARFNEIFADYAKRLRGHSLFELLVVFLGAPGRAPQYNSNQLMDYCVNELSPPLLMQTINEIEERHNNYAFN